MSSINASPSAALPVRAQPSSSAWREEMLGQLLSSMREHKNMEPKEKETPALQEMRPVFGKGHYVDVYV